MSTKILKVNLRTTNVEAIAVSGSYEYNVNYQFIGKDLIRLQCNINKVAKVDGVTNQSYSGYMSQENGNRSLNFPEGEDMVPHIAMFDSIVTEVKGEIAIV